MWSVFLLGVLAIITIVGAASFDDAYAITCSDKKEIFKFRTREAYCVTESTFDKLVERGWGDGRYAFYDVLNYYDISTYDMIKSRIIHMPLFIALGGGTSDSVSVTFSIPYDTSPQYFGRGTFTGNNNTEYAFIFHLDRYGFEQFTITDPIIDVNISVLEPPTTYDGDLVFEKFINSVSSHVDFTAADGISDSISPTTHFIIFGYPYEGYGGGTFNSITGNVYDFYYVYDEEKGLKTFKIK